MLAAMMHENRQITKQMLQSRLHAKGMSTSLSKHFIYLKGSFEVKRFDDDVCHTPKFEANFSYLTGLNCLSYDSLLDLENDRVYLVDILNKYKGGFIYKEASAKDMAIWGIDGCLDEKGLEDYLEGTGVERIYLYHGASEREKVWSNHWVPRVLEQWAGVMDFDTLYPGLNGLRAVKNPVEIRAMREVILFFSIYSQSILNVLMFVTYGC